MKIKLIFLLVVFTFVGCTTLFVTEQFVTENELVYLSERDSRSELDYLIYKYEEFIPNCSLGIRLSSVYRNRYKAIISDSLYSLNFWIETKSDLIKSYEFIFSNLEVTFLPVHIANNTPIAQRKPSLWRDFFLGKNSSFYKLYFDSLYIPDKIDSIKIVFDATIINPQIFDTTSKSFDFKMYRYENSYKVSKIGLWLMNN